MIDEPGRATIRRAWPVRADAADWRDADGLSLAHCVAEWVELQRSLGRLPARSAAGAALTAGVCCGWTEPNTEDQTGPPVYMLTQSAMTACLTELGIECATPSALHHVVADLVDVGLLHQQQWLHLHEGPAIVMYRLIAR